MDSFEKEASKDDLKNKAWKWVLFFSILFALIVEAVFFGVNSFFNTVILQTIKSILSVFDHLPNSFWHFWIILASGGWIFSCWQCFQKNSPKIFKWMAFLLPIMFITPGVHVFLSIPLYYAFLATVTGTIALIIALLMMGISFF